MAYLLERLNMNICYFFSQYNFNANVGIYKKIKWQIDALSKCCNTVIYSLNNNGNQDFYEKNNKLFSIDYKYEKGWFCQFIIGILFGHYCKRYHINAVYCRGTAIPFSLGAKIINSKLKFLVEIPTDIICTETELTKKIIFYIKNIKWLISYITTHRYVVFSSHQYYYGVKTIRISNGISFEENRLKNNTHSELFNFIIVAVASPYHGVDLFLDSLESCKNANIRFHIVGESKVITELQNSVKNKNLLSSKVIFYGFKSGVELDNLYDIAHIGVSSLATWRVGLKAVKNLKSREYVARGLPFIYAGSDPDFDDKQYVYKLPLKFDKIDFDDVIKWYKSLPNNIGVRMRNEHINSLSWDAIMRQVIEQIV